MTASSLSTEMQEALQKIFAEVVNEREYQISRFGLENDSKVNKPNDWVTYITGYATQWLPGGFAPYDHKALRNFRKSMLKVATLAFAAAHETDRILSGKNIRDDILDPDAGVETTGVVNATKNIPLAILAHQLRDRGFDVKFMLHPVVMYRDQVIETRTVVWNNDYSIFDEFEGHMIFLLTALSEDGPLPDDFNDVGAIRRIRFGVL